MVTLGMAAAARAAEKSNYAGALDGYESNVKVKTFDPVDWTLELYKSAPLKMTFRASSRRQAEAWQRQLRAKVAELLGGFPAKAVPLSPITLETRDFPGYRREKFVIQTRPGLSLLGYLLTPASGKGPYPAMICVPGHGRGVDDIVGIDEQGKDRTKKVDYQYDFAIQAVEHGLASVAIEPIAFGCRRGPAAKKEGLGTSSCQPTAGAALLLGQTMIGWRVYDVLRTIDWIETRKELDGARVGCMGISGGGTCTTFAAALEPRIRTAFLSCSFCTFRDSIFSISHCIDNYVPGILNWAEMYDVAGLIAPRPLFVESGAKDDIFPLEPSRAAFARLKRVYEEFDSTNLLEHEVFDAAHSFHGGRGWDFVVKHLSA